PGPDGSDRLGESEALRLAQRGPGRQREEAHGDADPRLTGEDPQRVEADGGVATHGDDLGPPRRHRRQPDVLAGRGAVEGGDPASPGQGGMDDVLDEVALAAAESAERSEGARPVDARP